MKSSFLSFQQAVKPVLVSSAKVDLMNAYAIAVFLFHSPMPFQVFQVALLILFLAKTLGLQGHFQCVERVWLPLLHNRSVNVFRCFSHICFCEMKNNL